MARPRAGTHTVETPVRLRRAALAAFARHGYAGAKLADIAAGAGVRRASLLYHYADKPALYAAVVEDVFLALGASLEGAMAPAVSPEAGVAALVRAFGGFLDGHPDVARVLLREVLDDRGPGRDLLRSLASPLKLRVGRFLRGLAGTRLRAGRNLGGAVMMLATNILVRAASGDLRGPLWGARDADAAWAQALLLKEDG